MPDKNELSEREQEVLCLVATGVSNKEIAQTLYISTNTVKVHLRHIYAKIGVASRTEAALYAVDTGIAPRAGLAQGEASESKEGAAQVQDGGNGMQGKRTRYLGNTWGVRGLLVFVFLVVVGAAIYLMINNVGPSSQQFSSPAEIPRWQLMADIPTPRFGLAVISLENQIYAISGESESGVTGIVEQFDPQSNTWVELLAKPTAVADVSAVVIGGKFYVPGGRTASGEVTDVIEIYDPRTDEWTVGLKMPKALSAYGLIDFEGKIYLFGGWDGQEFVSQVYEYAPELDTWREIESMPTARGYMGVARAGDRIYVLGGFNGKMALNVNEIFVPALSGTQDGPWLDGTPLTESLYGMGATSIADIIYVIGGKSEGQQEFSSLAFFSGKEEWRAVENPENEFGAYLGVVSSGTQLYAIGGEVQMKPSSNNQVYQAIYTISIPVIVK